MMSIERKLHEKANSIRQRNLITIHEAGSGHIGGDFSAADILTTLYFGGILNVDSRQPHHLGRV
jgi:transketolase